MIQNVTVTTESTVRPSSSSVDRPQREDAHEDGARGPRGFWPRVADGLLELPAAVFLLARP
jgi:hypothetical protein